MPVEAPEPTNGISRYVATAERGHPSLCVSPASGPIVLHLQSYGRKNYERREQVFETVNLHRFIDTEKLDWKTIKREDKKLKCSGTNGRVMLNIAVARGMCW